MMASWLRQPMLWRLGCQTYARQCTRLRQRAARPYVTTMDAQRGNTDMYENLSKDVFPEMSTALDPMSTYMRLVESQELVMDSCQVHAITALQGLYEDLAAYVPADLLEFDQRTIARARVERTKRLAALAKQLAEKEAEMFAHLDHRPQENSNDVESATTTPSADESTHTSLASSQYANENQEDAVSTVDGLLPPQGVYLWGPVGCGKTLVMDMFYESVNVVENRKQRLHFHSFMRDVLRHYHQLYTRASTRYKDQYDDDLLRPLAKAIAKQSYLLCFDEIQIPDIATASVLYRLFEYLHEYGVVVVGTGNRAPEALYQGHFEETQFSRWVHLMDDKWDVIEMTPQTDYRKRLSADVRTNVTNATDPFSECYFVPSGVEAEEKMNTCFAQLTAGDSVQPNMLTVGGRSVRVPQCTTNGVARFDFAALCATPLGAADYLVIASTYHTLFIDNIPEMTVQRRDQARRFISLVDALYECKCKLFCDATCPPVDMFTHVADDDAMRYDIMHREMMTEMYNDMDYKGKVFHNKLFTGEEELFASERCVSRLCEMRSPLYRLGSHRPHRGVAGLRSDCLDFGDDLKSGDHDATAVRDTAGAVDVGAFASQAAPLPGTLPHDLRDDRPRFTSDKHFFGAGWWENLKDKFGRRHRRQHRDPE